jgi:hypothetical protein
MPASSRKRRPSGLSGTIPHPTSFVTTNRGQGGAENVPTSARCPARRSSTRNWRRAGQAVDDAASNAGDSARPAILPRASVRQFRDAPPMPGDLLPHLLVAGMQVAIKSTFGRTRRPARRRSGSCRSLRLP